MEGASGEVDIFRDTPVRYLGYANEIGESFRALVDVKWVRLSYVVASAYVCADAASKGLKVFKSLPEADASHKARKTGEMVVDTLVWQGFASVAIPGFTINRICWLSSKILSNATKLPPMTRKWTATAIGLGCIPLIIHPIDRFVDWSMDNSLRKVLNTHVSK